MLSSLKTLFDAARSWADQHALGSTIGMLGIGACVALSAYYVIMSLIWMPWLLRMTAWLTRRDAKSCKGKRGESFIGRIVQLAWWSRRGDQAADAWDMLPASKSGTARCSARHLAEGDLCTVQLVTDMEGAWVRKRPRSSDGSPLVTHEHAVICQLQGAAGHTRYGDYLPWPAECVWDRDRAVATYRWRSGFVEAMRIVQWFPHGMDGRHVAWMFNRILEILGFAHQRGWVHGGLFPPHLLFHPDDHGLQLLGWMHAVPVGHRLSFGATNYRHWYPLECHSRKPATPATDLFMAATCAVWLASGGTSTTVVPAHLPAPMRGLFERCLLLPTALRPARAWSLRDEFGEVLQKVYGPPRFCPLTPHARNSP